MSAHETWTTVMKNMPTVPTLMEVLTAPVSLVLREMEWNATVRNLSKISYTLGT